MHIEIRAPKRSEFTFINNLISQAFKVQTAPIELSFFYKSEYSLFSSCSWQNLAWNSQSSHYPKK